MAEAAGVSAELFVEIVEGAVTAAVEQGRGDTTLDIEELEVVSTDDPASYRDRFACFRHSNSRVYEIRAVSTSGPNVVYTVRRLGAQRPGRGSDSVEVALFEMPMLHTERRHVLAAAHSAVTRANLTQAISDPDTES